MEEEDRSDGADGGETGSSILHQFKSMEGSVNETKEAFQSSRWVVMRLWTRGPKGTRGQVWTRLRECSRCQWKLGWVAGNQTGTFHTADW